MNTLQKFYSIYKISRIVDFSLFARISGSPQTALPAIVAVNILLFYIAQS